MFPRLSGRFLGTCAVIGALLLLLAPAAANAQVVVKVNDTVNFRFGLQIQSWADWTQDPNSEGYSQNLFIRRIRAQMLATVAPNVTIFYQTDNPRAGNAGATGDKIINTGFLTQDAFAEWKFCDPVMLEGGLFLVPTNRNGLTSTASFLSFDIGTWALQGNGIMKGNGGRDYGFGLKSYLLDNHLEIRTGVFQGNRNPTGPPQTAPLGPAAGSRNPFRFAGRIQYNFFDPEVGYVYAGTNRGTKKILAVGAWGDGQGDYKAYGGDVFVDFPIMKDAITAEFDYSHFEGGNDFPTLAKQDDIFANAGWYFDVVKLQPFIRYERLYFSNTADIPKGQDRLGGGFNWYVFGQNLKLSAFYEKIMPRTKPLTASIKDTNHFVVQLQVLYF